MEQVTRCGNDDVICIAEELLQRWKQAERTWSATVQDEPSADSQDLDD